MKTVPPRGVCRGSGWWPGMNISQVGTVVMDWRGSQKRCSRVSVYHPWLMGIGGLCSVCAECCRSSFLLTWSGRSRGLGGRAGLGTEPCFLGGFAGVLLFVLHNLSHC